MLKVIFLNILRQVVYLQETVRELQSCIHIVSSTQSISAPSRKSVTTQKSASRKVSQNTSQTKITSLFKNNPPEPTPQDGSSVLHSPVPFRLCHKESHLSALKNLLTFGTSKAQA